MAWASTVTSVLPRPEPAAEWRGVSVAYPHQRRPVLDAVDLALGRGERLLLLGPSGCGKSTLLATLTGLVPISVEASVEGDIMIDAVDVTTRGAADWASHVAFLFQDAEQTLCGMTVADEIGFALENRAAPEGEIRRAIDAAMSALDLPPGWRGRWTATLSGGERQLVAIAAAQAQAAPMLVADEPSANLAPEAAQRLRRVIRRHRGSVLLVDHRLDRLVDLVDRIVLLDRDGRLAAKGAPRDFFRTHASSLEANGVWRPLAARLDEELARNGVALAKPPLTLDELLRQLPDIPASRRATAHDILNRFAKAQTAPPQDNSGDVLVELQNAACAPLFGPVVLPDASVSVRAGELVAILGRNGAGKSTLAMTLAGLLRPRRGRRIGDPAGVSFQNPENQFTGGSVADELAQATASCPGAAPSCEELLAHWGLQGLERRHPFELSHGQKRRLALATLTAGDRWPWLVLDEPTAGLDFANTETLVGHIRALAAHGAAIVIVTHDVDFAFRVCHRAIVVDSGSIAFDGPMPALARDTDLLRRAGLEEPSIGPLLSWLELEPQC